MGEMLLINPRKRARKSAKRKTARRVVRRANPAPARRRRTSHARRRNPASLVRRHVTRRRITRRRRNPISLGSSAQWMAMAKDAAVGAAGAVGMDVLWGYINAKLPASMMRTPGTPGLGDAVKAAATVVLGVVLNKATKGLSKKAAQGALTVQAAEVLRTFVPDTMSLGYVSPARLTNMNNRIGPNGGRMGRFANIQSPVLGLRAEGSPMLGASAAVRESVVR